MAVMLVMAKSIVADLQHEVVTVDLLLTASPRLDWAPSVETVKQKALYLVAGTSPKIRILAMELVVQAMFFENLITSSDAGVPVLNAQYTTPS